MIFLHISPVEDVAEKLCLWEKSIRLMNTLMHRDIHLDVNDISDCFASKKRKFHLFLIVKVTSVFCLYRIYFSRQTDVMLLS